MASFYISPFVTTLSERNVGGDTAGFGHLLTGVAIAVPEQLAKILQVARTTGLQWEELSLLRAHSAARDALERFAVAHFLVDSLAPEALLRPFLDLPAGKPLLNPIVSRRRPRSVPEFVGPSSLDLVRLPRRGEQLDVKAETIEGPAGLLWNTITDAEGSFRQPLGKVLEQIGEPERWRALMWCTARNRQLLRVATGTHDPAAAGPHHALLQDRIWELDKAGAVEALHFYQDPRLQAQFNFDWIEPTVAHAFRFPTSAFGGQTYGERCCDRILAEARPMRRILEIGGGLGVLAAGFLRQAQRRLGSVLPEYSILDCAPAFQAHQRDVLKHAPGRVCFHLGDARKLDLPGERFDLILANEVIADFAPLREGTGEEWQQFLVRLARHLAPGGMAVLIEYGAEHSAPRRTEHLNHPEFSIDFGTLSRWAKALGFVSRTIPLQEWLEFDGDAQLLCGQQEHLWCLQQALDLPSTDLPYAAWDRQTWWRVCGNVADEYDLRGPEFAAASAGLHFGPDLRQFMVLTLVRSEV